MSEPPPAHPSLESWIRSEASSFAVDDPESIAAAVDRVMAYLGPSVQMLGLGEPTHQVEGFLEFRDTVFRHLVEHHGFTAIAIESSYPRGRLVNDYVQHRTSRTLDDVLAEGVSHGFGTSAANRDLVEWMRDYSAQHPDRALRFAGCDAPTEMTYSDSPRKLLESALGYLQMASDKDGAERRGRISELVGDDAAWENEQANLDPTQSIGNSPEAKALAIEVRKLHAIMRKQKGKLVTHSDLEAYEAAIEDLRLAQQLLTYHSIVATPSDTRMADMLAQRDVMMADNLVYIASSEQWRGRVLAFAHNSHLQLGKAEWQWGENNLSWWPAGSHVRGQLGIRYSVIGVGAGRLPAYDLGPPEEGSLEALLTTGGESRFVPTHRGVALPVDEVEALTTRTADPRYFPFTQQSLTDFDMLAVLDSAE